MVLVAYWGTGVGVLEAVALCVCVVVLAVHVVAPDPGCVMWSGGESVFSLRVKVWWVA